MIEFPDGTVYDLRVENPPSTRPPLYYLYHDAQLWTETTRKGLPEVIPFDPVHKVYLTDEKAKAWLELQTHFAPKFTDLEIRVSLTNVCQTHLALMNNSGLGDDDNPRRNWWLNRFYGYPLAAWDKVRSMGGSVVTGVDVYSLVEGLRIVRQLLQNLTRAKNVMGVVRMATQALYANNVLQIETLNADEPPPSTEWLLAHPWFFYYCVLAYNNRAGYFPQMCVNDLNIYQDTVSPLYSSPTRTMTIDLYRTKKLSDTSPIPDPHSMTIPA